ncbi:DegT/DnrJ/EryC1/StrS family aminotransferase [uncultured Gammaproteobacteria bacterium]
MPNAAFNPPALAIEGGAPLRSTPMPTRIALGPDEERMIGECLAWYRERREDPGYQGRFEALYCHDFVQAMGGGYADAVATGTVAVFVALAALGLPKGSQVICSPITDPGTLTAIVLNGLVPRLADARPGSYGIGVEEFRARITPAVKAVVVVHALGQASDIEAIVAEARHHDIRVVEDCSQAHGAVRNGQPVGSFGDIAAFSTMYRKAHITGASGGIVYSRDLNLFRMALAHADRGKPSWVDGFDDRDPNQFLFPALNLHTDELSCAIGIASFKRLPQTIARRRAFVTAVSAGIEAECQLCRPYGYTTGDSPFVYPVMVDVARLNVSKTEFARAVLAEGIGLNPHYQYLVADWAFLKPYFTDTFDTPNARACRDSSFCLYLNENYGEQEAADCVAAIKKVEYWYHRA